MRKEKKKRFNRIFLLDCSEQELMQNKRVFEMLDLAEEVLTFDKADEALQHLLQPGQVPDLVIAGSKMQDSDIRHFMRSYETLPEWVTGSCRICLLLEPVEQEEGEQFYHPLLYRTMHRPLCPFELMEDEDSY